MKRRAFLMGTVALAAVGSPAAAQSATDQVVRQLRQQGYNDFRISRTLLGRVRITSTSRRARREVILNPSTGAILRDYIDRRDDSDDRDDERDDRDDRDDDRDSSGPGSGRDEDDDDDDDDDSDRDSSGSGSGRDDGDDDDDDDD